MRRPVVVATAQEILDESANVAQVVPLTQRFGRLAQRLKSTRTRRMAWRQTPLRSVSTSGQRRSIVSNRLGGTSALRLSQRSVKCSVWSSTSTDTARLGTKGIDPGWLKCYL